MPSSIFKETVFLVKHLSTHNASLVEGKNFWKHKKINLPPIQKAREERVSK